MDDLIKFLRARLDEDEAWALACNRPYEYADEGSVAPETGVHWRWVAGENYATVTPDPAAMEFLEDPDGYVTNIHLATVEEWPCSSDSSRVVMMPRTYFAAEEVDPAAAGHIARHDPARVLADVAAKRDLVDECERAFDYGGWADDYRLGERDFANFVLHRVALPYADHPDFRAEWRLGAGTTPPGE